MKKKFFLSVRYIFRNKKNIIAFVIIGLSISMLVVATFFKYTTDNYINNGIKKSSVYKVLYVNNSNSNDMEKVKNQIRSIRYVTGVFKEYSYQTGVEIDDFKTDKLDGSVWVYSATNETLPEIVEGSNFPDYEHNYMICPENFYPTAAGNSEFYKDLKKEDAIDIKSMLGKDFTFEYKSFGKGVDRSTTFKLVGLYKNQPNTVDEGQCYVTEQSVNEMFLNYSSDEENFDITNYRNFYVEVDKYENVETVRNELERFGFTSEPIAQVSQDFLDSINSTTNMYVLVIVAFTILLIFITIIKEFKNNKNYYKLLYFLGYSKKDISQICIISNVFKLMFSSLITIGSILLIKCGISYLTSIYPFRFYKWEITINYTEVIFTMIVVTILTIILTLFNVKKINVDKTLE